MASGQQQLTIDEICANNAYQDGMNDSIKAIHDIYILGDDKREFLFGSKNFLTIIGRYTPKEMIDILNKKDQLLAQRVLLGDVIEGPYSCCYLITYIYNDKIHFDCISLDNNTYGHTVENTSLQELQAKRKEERRTNYFVIKGSEI